MSSKSPNGHSHCSVSDQQIPLGIMSAREDEHLQRSLAIISWLYDVLLARRPLWRRSR